MESQYKKKQVGDLREHDSQFNVCCAIISQPNERQKQTSSPRWCDWTELFMSTIEFPRGGQIELMV